MLVSFPLSFPGVSIDAVAGLEVGRALRADVAMMVAADASSVHIASIRDIQSGEVRYFDKDDPINFGEAPRAERFLQSSTTAGVDVSVVVAVASQGFAEQLATQLSNTTNDDFAVGLAASLQVLSVATGVPVSALVPQVGSVDVLVSASASPSLPTVPVPSGTGTASVSAESGDGFGIPVLVGACIGTLLVGIIGSALVSRHVRAGPTSRSKVLPFPPPNEEVGSVSVPTAPAAPEQPKSAQVAEEQPVLVSDCETVQELFDSEPAPRAETTRRALLPTPAPTSIDPVAALLFGDDGPDDEMQTFPGLIIK
jgi:hypothetical protein